MNIADLNGKNVCVLGYGREGKAMVKALEHYAPGCEITIADRDERLKTHDSQHWMQVGTGWLENLRKFDVLIKSPGIPPFPEFTVAGSRLTSSTQIFLDTIEEQSVTVIGVTGSKGKSTTASLIHAILQAGGKNVHLTGNIGDPAIAHLAEAVPGAVFVLEMSSYQLMDLKKSPHIAVVTSFFPEHLDYHGSLDQYLEAKKHITRFQGPEDIVFFCADAPGAAEIAKEGNGRKIPFSMLDSPVSIEETHLIGRHNLQNIAAACAVADLFSIPMKKVIRAVKEFEGLPHRLEHLGTIGGIEWIDDAISTTPESTIAALDALGDRVHAIILGGQDRGYDFSGLAQRLAQSSVKIAILFPGSGPRIREAIEATSASIRLFDAASMEEAVCIAKEQAQSSTLETPPIVLLSTASPSYGMFKNFEEKGMAFRQCIESESV